ncbi:MAG: hypothetical protein EZS28_020838 [Streblomastix strix]|uniref:Uncharacterized protein n=1 Tax=Streblomastix strix TaxID=222440 RepID=A0A5J4VMG9_9EUKA|nr:MAG: hypothetical protein EZS28_020838 [Streblomastix strix]
MSKIPIVKSTVKPEEKKEIILTPLEKFKLVYATKCKEASIQMYKPLLKTLDRDEENLEKTERIFIQDDKFGIKGLSCLLTALKEYPSINEFAFYQIGSGDEGIQLICNFIIENPRSNFSLEIFDNITIMGCRQLSRLFLTKGPHILQTIILDHNPIGDAGSLALAEGAKDYQNLRHLSLKYCGIGTVGGLALVTLLLANTSKCKIESLNLQGNEIGSRPLSMLGLALPQCNTLKEIGIADIGVSEDDQEALDCFCDGVAQNRSLEKINIDLNNIDTKTAPQISSDVFKRILDALMDNRTKAYLNPTEEEEEKEEEEDWEYEEEGDKEAEEGETKKEEALKATSQKKKLIDEHALSHSVSKKISQPKKQ